MTRKYIPNEIIDMILIFLGDVDICIALKHYYPLLKIGYTIAKACRNNQLDAVKYLVVNREVTVWAMYNAAAGGHLNIVKYLHENHNIRYINAVMDKAITAKHLEVVKYFHKIGLNCSTNIIDSIIYDDDLEMIKYLFSIGKKPTITAMNNAIMYNCKKIAKFLRENDLGAYSMTAVAYAIKYKLLGVTDYLRVGNFNDRILMKHAIAIDDIGMIKGLLSSDSSDVTE